MEVFTDCSSHSGDTVGHRSKRMGASRGRSEKNAIRVCGDWSEQLSSKGKIYFYNCITEVSQWQKPPEWKLPDMDHEELVRRLRAREQLDTRNLKRSRAVSTTHTNNTKESDSEQRSASPKRAKYLTDLRNRNPIQDRKLSPAVQSETSVDRNNCINNAAVNKVCSQRRMTSRSSPRKNYERSLGECRYQAQPRKDVGASASRLAPTDDMDISPNSSPMSGGSSPVHPSYHVQSIASRRIRSSVIHPVASERTTYGLHKMNAAGQAEATTHSNKSGPLRQLVDVIRASIGGLLNESPSSGGSKSALDNYSATNGAQTCDRTKLYSSAFSDKDTRYRSPSYATHVGCIRTQTIPSPESSIAQPYKVHSDKSISCDPSSRSGLANSNAKNVSDVHRSQTGDIQNKNISGLVSTLTTLVSLISNTRCSHPSSTSPSVTSAPAPGITHVSCQRTPTHPYSTSQRAKQHVTSPAIPSPLTPSANTGTSSSGGSSSSRITHSMLASSACNLSSHQMDDLLSSLENLTQQARSGSAKLLTDCCQASGQRTLSDYGGPPDDQLLQTNHGLTSPHTGRPYYWSQSRVRERCDGTKDPSVTEKPTYRAPNQTHQADRINDLVKVLKSAMQQHLSARSPVSSNNDPLNPVLPHISTPLRAHETTPVLTDVAQSNRSESRSYVVSPSSYHPPGSIDSHMKTSANGHVLDGDGLGSGQSSRFITTGASPCIIDDGSSTHLHSNASSSAAVPDAGGHPPASTSRTPILTITSANTSCVVTGRSSDQQVPSPVERLVEDDCINRISRLLTCPETQQLVDPVIATKYVDKALERLEQEAQVEARKFDRLQSVLYGELSAESKKLRALVRISEAKLAIHKEKQSALQELMDAIETRRHLPSLSFSDDV